MKKGEEDHFTLEPRAEMPSTFEDFYWGRAAEPDGGSAIRLETEEEEEQEDGTPQDAGPSASDEIVRFADRLFMPTNRFERAFSIAFVFSVAVAILFGLFRLVIPRDLVPSSIILFALLGAPVALSLAKAVLWVGRKTGISQQAAKDWDDFVHTVWDGLRDWVEEQTSWSWLGWGLLAGIAFVIVVAMFSEGGGSSERSIRQDIRDVEHYNEIQHELIENLGR